MGYQVGRICYSTEQEAINVLMTQVVPTIDKDGVLHHPVFNGTSWTYKQQTVMPTFPQCDEHYYTKHAQQIGTNLVAVFISICVVFIAVRAIFLMMKEKDE
ncbi:hypothetical protein GJV52_12490 [Neisseria brasiliensis]|uniref:hypothetical protein n=1 Tax=Neisseria TaxID=482 RepID=UPI000C274540|nr:MULTISPECIES: hypothetical protein [Neisseria]PJO77691.1 hypothetical protein CWC45_08920 [Neisseria sp. N177_16]QGL26272.1 hypothetical protein GJV52_12490 [Neisseria brasiliensis]